MSTKAFTTTNVSIIVFAFDCVAIIEQEKQERQQTKEGNVVKIANFYLSAREFVEYSADIEFVAGNTFY